MTITITEAEELLLAALTAAVRDHEFGQAYEVLEGLQVPRLWLETARHFREFVMNFERAQGEHYCTRLHGIVADILEAVEAAT